MKTRVRFYQNIPKTFTFQTRYTDITHMKKTNKLMIGPEYFHTKCKYHVKKKNVHFSD